MVKPKVIFAENVKGLLFKKAKGYVNEILKALKKAGYDVQIFLLNSAKIKVLQTRERTFFIARRKYGLNLPQISLDFNEKPIKYKGFKDKNFKPLDKSTQTYKYWCLRKSEDSSLKGSAKTDRKRGKLITR